MPTLAPFQASRVIAAAVVVANGRPVVLDCRSVSVTYAINSIPTAELDLAPGYRAQDGWVTTLALLDTVRQANGGRVPIQVRVQMVDRLALAMNGRWPRPTSYLLFAGFVTDASAARSRQAAAIRLSCVGWLGGLTSGSFVSASYAAVTPDMIGPAAFAGVGGGAGLFWEQSAARLFGPANLAADLWGQAAKPWLLGLCERDVLRDPGERPGDGPDPAEVAGVAQEAGAPAPENEEAAFAVSRIEPDDAGAYAFGRPVRFAPGLFGSAPRSVADWVADGAFRDAGGMTAWDYLVGGLLPAFRLALIPLPSRALVVPYVPGRAAAWVTLGADEYMVEEAQTPIGAPVRSVRMLFPGGLPDMPNGLRWGGRAAARRFAGVYEPDGVDVGRVIFGTLPPWAAGFHPAAFGPDAAGGRGPIGNALAPKDPVDHPDAAGAADARDGWDAYAHAVYVTEALRGRAKVVTGKLRFDVGPGSTVQLLGPGEDPNRRDQLNPNAAPAAAGQYAEVEAVTVTIDGEAPAAATHYQLANVRSWVEAFDERSSVPGHPLYDETFAAARRCPRGWRGCPLIDSADFVPRFRIPWHGERAAADADGPPDPPVAAALGPNEMGDDRWPALSVAPRRFQPAPGGGGAG